MKVYITYDKSFHEIICVHQIPNIDCEICKPIRELKDRNDEKTLIEIIKEVQNPVNVYDSPAILGYYDDEIKRRIENDTDADDIPEIKLNLETRVVEVEQRKLENISVADEEDQQPEPNYFNPKSGKTQKLFDVLNKVYTVCYRNHEVGDKGEALYITLEANDEPDAVNKAMANKEFTKHIYMKYFNIKCMNVYEPKGNYVIGKIEYFEGDPRL